MVNLFQILLPIGFVILLWVLIHTLQMLQLHLYYNYRPIWEEVTFKRFFFVKREDFPTLPVNHRIFKVIFSKTEFGDKVMDALKLRIRILLLICIVLSTIIILCSKYSA